MISDSENQAIYQHLVDKEDIEPPNAVFVDDRLKNLAPAEALGFATEFTV